MDKEPSWLSHIWAVAFAQAFVRVTHSYVGCVVCGMGCPSRRSPSATGGFVITQGEGVEKLLRVPILHWSETVEADPGDWSPRVHLVCSASRGYSAATPDCTRLGAEGARALQEGWRLLAYGCRS